MKNLYRTVLLLVIVLAGCKKSSSTDNTATTTGEYYFKGTLNDQPLSWQGTDDFTGYVTGIASNISTDSKGMRTGSLIALFSLSNNGTYQPQLAIEFRTYSFSYDLKDKAAYFASFLSTGSIPVITTNISTPNTRAVIINYTDAQGRMYSSVGAQTTASANIVSLTNVPAQFGRNESLKIKMTFNCKLYPSGNGTTLTLNNAEATVRLEDVLN